MSAEAALVTRSWRAGRYTCTLSVQRPKAGAVAHCCVEWAPQEPKRLTKTDLVEYLAGRNKALAEVSRELGINAAVIDL